MKTQPTLEQLISLKATSYHKLQIETIGVVVTEAAETDRILYQEDVMRIRDTQMVFKHSKIA